MSETLKPIPEQIKRADPYEITVMPDKETLQDYLRGSGGEGVLVTFNLEKGIFERVLTREEAIKLRKNGGLSSD